MSLPIDPGELEASCLYLWVNLAETRRGSSSYARAAEDPLSSRTARMRQTVLMQRSESRIFQKTRALTGAMQSLVLPHTERRIEDAV
jgi:hypothetical protein